MPQYIVRIYGPSGISLIFKEFDTLSDAEMSIRETKVSNGCRAAISSRTYFDGDRYGSSRIDEVLLETWTRDGNEWQQLSGPVKCEAASGYTEDRLKAFARKMDEATELVMNAATKIQAHATDDWKMTPYQAFDIAFKIWQELAKPSMIEYAAPLKQIPADKPSKELLDILYGTKPS